MRPADPHADYTGPANPAPASLARSPAPPTLATEHFAAALRAAVATGATDALSLRDAVRVFVEVCRGTGDPPERALIAVKERVLDALRRRPNTPKADAGALLRRVVHWAIEAYYRAD